MGLDGLELGIGCDRDQDSIGDGKYRFLVSREYLLGILRLTD